MASRLHEWKEQQEYLDRMLHHVKFKYDHIDIRREYREHMEDMLDYYVESGMDEDTAKHTVLEEMGDADSLGRVLNEIHNPAVGWIWRVSRWVVTVAVVLSVFPLGLMTFSTGWEVLCGYDEPETDSELSYEVDINTFGHVDNYHFFFDKLEMYEDETAVLYYVQALNPLDRAAGWTWSWGYTEIRDGSGHVYRKETDNTGGGRLIEFRQMTVRIFSQKSEVFILDYDHAGRKIYVEVPLPAGKEAA